MDRYKRELLYPRTRYVARTRLAVFPLLAGLAALVPALMMTYGLIRGQWHLSLGQPTPAFVQVWGFTLVFLWFSWLYRETVYVRISRKEKKDVR